MSVPKITRNLTQTLRPISATYRRAIKRLFISRHGTGPLNDDRRVALEETIYVVENELECRSPQHPQVGSMRAIRNVLLDDLGSRTSAQTASYGNEVAQPGMVWPHVGVMVSFLQDPVYGANKNDDMSSEDVGAVRETIAA